MSKIVSIEISLKNYEPIKFTMGEAKELYEQLHELFGEEKQHFHYYPWCQPYYTWYNASGTALDQTNTIACSADLVGKSVASNNTGMQVSYLAN